MKTINGYIGCAPNNEEYLDTTNTPKQETTSDIFIDKTLRYKNISDEEYEGVIFKVNDTSTNTVDFEGKNVRGNVFTGRWCKQHFCEAFVVTEEKTQKHRELEETLEFKHQEIKELQDDCEEILEEIKAEIEIQNDPYKELKRVYKEGAIIQNNNFDLMDNICYFCPDQDYHIKGRISIECWDKHKEAIKAFWNGETVLRQDIDDEFYYYKVRYDNYFFEDSNYVVVK